MKIDITYEKADIIRLVTDDLKRKGIHPKSGAPVEYKGALSVKLSVDAEAEPEPTTVPESSGGPPQGRAEEASTPVSEPSMDDILAASRRAAASPPSFKTEKSPPRMLGKNEFYEYPED